MNHIAGSLNGKFPHLSTQKLEILGLLINNACNLSCKHCYLQADQFDKYLNHNEWMTFLNSVFTDLQPSVVSFAGKEVFLNRKSASILLDAIKLRNKIQTVPEQRTEIGVVTNGTLLHNFRQDLRNTCPDYIDISIDGLPKEHDFVRGAGAFDMLEPNLLWLKENFPGNIWITYTLLNINKSSLPEFIEFYHSKYGIQRFSLGLYTDFEYTDKKLKLETHHYHELIYNVFPALEKLRLNAPIEIIVDFNTNYLEIMDIFASNGWVNPVDPISSVTHEFDNGLTMCMNTARIPVGLWRSVRVTPEGYWLAAEDTMCVKEYDKFAAAKVRDCNYNAKALYHAGLRSERFAILKEQMDTQHIFPEFAVR